MNMKTILLEDDQSLSLTNDGELDLFFIGTGSAFAKNFTEKRIDDFLDKCFLASAQKTRGLLRKDFIEYFGRSSVFVPNLFQTNFLVVSGGTHILVDFGMTGPLALEAHARLKTTDINAILPTHSHSDHIGGIECAALMNRYVGIPFMNKSKIDLIINEEYQRILWENTLRGGMEYNEKDKNTGQKLSFVDFFNVIRPEWKHRQPRETWTTNYKGINIEIFRTKHIPDIAPTWETSFVSYGLYFPDFKVFVSVDTRFDPELLDIYSDAVCMFHDVQFFPGAVHAPLDELKTLPDDVKEKMLLMHYSDDWRKQNIDGFAGWTKAGVTYRFERV